VRSVGKAVLLSSFALLVRPGLAEGDLHRTERYLAQVLFYTEVSEATVVYPAGPGEDVARNRRSAIQRARYLETMSGMKTRVVSDAEVTEQDLSGHLLLLGWNNRLLGTDRARRPFERTVEGTSFLGILEPDPDVDLMFFYPSPYNPDRYLLFWSRIDPPRDRFMPLPMVGSDWAFYRDFGIVRQGMFRPARSWPPARDLEAEKDHTADHASLRSGESRTRGAHYDVVFHPGKIPNAEADAILNAREEALSRAASLLGVRLDGFRAVLYVYGDAELKKALTGVPDSAHIVPGRRELHMTRAAARTSSPHEEIHLLAEEAFGPCTVSALYEGLVVALGAGASKLDLDTHAAILLEKGSPPSLADVLDEERMRRGPAETTLAAAGLLLSWVRSVFGREGLARAYTIPEDTPLALERALGRPASLLQADFRGWLAERATTRKNEVAFMKAEAEARERYLVGDYKGVAEALQKALRFKPRDPQTLFNLASAQMRTGDYGEAERNLKLLLEQRLEGPNAHLEIFAHYQLGRLYDVQGLRERALAQYERVLALPDQHDAHRLAREAIERPVTKEQLE